MAFQPGLMNRALSNREMFRQVQTMPVTAYDPRPRRSQELMDYVGEGTEGQWKDPNKRPTAKSLAPKSAGEQTETGRQIKGALGGIGEGLAALFAEKKAPPKRERPTIPMKYVEEGTEGQFAPRQLQKALQQDLRNSSKGGYLEGIPRITPDTRSSGSRAELDAGHQHEGHAQANRWPVGSSAGEEKDPWARRAYKQHAKDRVAWTQRTGNIPSDEQVPPPKAR